MAGRSPIFRNSDADLRGLERAARAGDTQAAVKLFWELERVMGSRRRVSQHHLRGYALSGCGGALAAALVHGDRRNGDLRGEILVMARAGADRDTVAEYGVPGEGLFLSIDGNGDVAEAHDVHPGLLAALREWLHTHAEEIRRGRLMAVNNRLAKSGRAARMLSAEALRISEELDEVEAGIAADVLLELKLGGRQPPEKPTRTQRRTRRVTD